MIVMIFECDSLILLAIDDKDLASIFADRVSLEDGLRFVVVL
jgi:hypothetical protein